jgi:hypothetical protein
MSEQWIQQMQQKMADYKRPAPEVSWEEIDRTLAANKTRQPRLLWLRRIAAAAAFLLIAGVGYWGLLRNNTEENHGDWHNDSSEAKIRVPVPVMLDSAAKISVPAMLAETVAPVFESSPDTIHTAPTEEEALPHSNGESDSRPKEQTPPTPAPVIYPTDLHQRKHIDNRLTAKVYMSSTMADSQIKTNSQPNSPIIDNHNIHHYQPMRFGLSLRYRITDRWSIESGLSYTRLSSDISTTVDGVTTVTEQHLNYIGLPLNISYDLWKSNHFGLYVTAGGTIEKSLDTSPWQFSLNGAVGAEYKLTDFFSLYAEPGLGYYFKDGSTTPTIYQDRPLNINLSFGLRFNLK